MDETEIIAKKKLLVVLYLNGVWERAVFDREYNRLMDETKGIYLCPHPILDYLEVKQNA